MTVWELDLPLTTPRLVLRGHRPQDLDDLLVFHSDPAVTRYIPWPVRDREQTRAALAAKLDRTTAAPGEWLVLAVEERRTGTVVGEVLLRHADEPEVGYVLRADRQGRGLAAEAVGALLTAASSSLQVTTVVAVVVDGNAASVRLLGRLGFRGAGAGPLSSAGEPTTLFRRG
ncbi:GNAT family N-acetyltransferase [Cellulomonas sp. DKR-3]|uniref:GNAT family N-acetyltransferase n=1 Tax=Cellulomonas fulva TaxID=2835530 RepID=A0ABS5TYC2_9CELL|nr:GNAT family N-acetyltransferase [Cellulomonas fulva]MBT0994101.1 GNAT family N-acetyltransferase [Cellulomonas fulva]